MSAKVTAPAILSRKGGDEPIVCLTAYDVLTASIADDAGVELVLVGDSVGNAVMGYATTIPVTLEQMVHHTKAARAGVKRALLVSDLPFGTYQASVSQAVESAITLARAGAEAVKLEGAYCDEIAAIARAGLPVMGHVGMTPQSVNAFGGFKVQGRGGASSAVVDASKAIQDAGAFCIVLELIPADLAARITEELDIPTIGIGAGPACDGQIQVFHDVVGWSSESFKHSKAYANGREILAKAVRDYSCEVRNGAFPTQDHSF